MGIVIAMGMITDTAAADAFGFGTWSGEVELGYEHENQDTRFPVGSTEKFERDRYNERLTLRNNGFYFVDPKFMIGNLSLTLDKFQENGNTDGVAVSRDGDLNGYAVDTTFLSYKPYSATLFANRNQDLVTREFGGRSEISFENRGARLHLREDSFLKDLGVDYFSSTLGARQEHSKESTTVLDQRFDRDEERDILTWEANKGFLTADLGLRYEITDVRDNLVPQRNYQTDVGNLNYSVDFGPTLNRRWDSRVYYFNRTGDSPVKFVTADEELRLDHNEGFFTDYRYFYSRREALVGTSITQIGTFRAHQVHYKNLTTDYVLSAQREDLSGGERTRDSGEAGLNYRRTFSAGHTVYARFGGRYQLDENNLTDDVVNVIDETHIAPSPLVTGFLLNNPFVIASTIVVVDVTQGNATTLLGVDYNVVQEGDFTRIIPLSTSAIIQVGDQLAVSYAFEVAPRIKFSTASWWIGAGVDLDWIAFSFDHEQFDEQLRGGQGQQFLDDQSTDSARVELRGALGSIRSRAFASLYELDSTRLKYTRWQWGGGLTYRPRYQLTLRLDVDQSTTDFSLPKRESETSSVRSAIDWYTATGWLVTGYVNVQSFKDDISADEELREAGVRGRRIFGKLEVVPLVAWYERERGAVDTSNMRFEIKATRRF